MRITFFLLLIPFCTAVLFPRPLISGDKEDLHAMILSTYDFSPCSLDEDLLKNKAESIDKFWSYVGEKPERAKLLRDELKQYKGNGFFLFDGASLLLQQSSGKEDLAVAADALSRVDMCGINTGNYFLRAHSMGTKGADIWPVMARILNDESFHVIITERSITFGQDYCVLYLSLAADERFWLDRTIARLEKETSPRTSKALITAIAFSVTEKGQKAIARCAQSHPDKGVRVYAKIFTALESADRYKRPDVISIDRTHIPAYLDSIVYEKKEGLGFDPEQFAKEFPHVIVKKDYAAIKTARAKIAARVSNEALDEVFYLTALMQIALTAKE
jgi:hypothetical protein